MAIGQVRTNGSAATNSTTAVSGAFNFGGYQPLLLVFTQTGVATADTGGSGSAIVEGTRTKAIRAIAQYGTILATDSASGTGAVAVLVDQATFNQAAGTTTAGAFGAVIDAVAAATGTSAATLTKSYGFTSAGVWTLG
jgi:hypothetical protein